MPLSRPFFYFSALLALAACGPDEPKDVTYYRDVKPIIDGRCAGCHTEGGIAPFSLESYADVHARRVSIRAATAERIMPPWIAERGHRAYRYDPSLSSEEIAMIGKWVDRGAKKGSASDSGEKLPQIGPGLSRVDVVVKVPEPYTPKNSTGDEYRCFVLDLKLKTEKFLTGFNAIPGVMNEVHHVALYLAPPDLVPTVEKWDAEEGPGYTCFGGPSGRNAEQIPVNLLGFWIPGNLGNDYPKGTGIKIKPGSKIILQLHYNNDNAPPTPDQTAVELKLDDEVTHKASYAPWLDVDWVASDKMTIPAGKKNVRHSMTGNPMFFFSAFSGGLKIFKGFTIYSALLHLHTLGTGGTIQIIRENGKIETLLEIPRWDFHWQREYYLVTPVQFNPGDKLKVECRWDNSAEHQPMIDGKRKVPADVKWGEGSTEEMCVGNLFISEL